MKYLPLLFLFASFGVKGQDKNIITGLNAGYKIHIGIWTGQLSIPWGYNTPQDTSGNTSYGMSSATKLTTGTSGNKYGKAAIDTPQADRNPNDFYVDTLGDTSYVMNTPHGRISSKDLSLEEKLLQYAAECWSDSILNVYAKDSTYAPLKGVGIFYIHREPTFKGFIEYLKKK